jgi:hypothetical protein
MNLIDLIIDKFDGVIIDDDEREHYRVKGKKYDICFDRQRVEWSCNCPAFTFRHKFKRTGCKHITEVKLNKSKRLFGI